MFNVHLIALTSDKYKILENIVLWSAGEFKGSEKDIAYDMLWLARAWPYAAIVLEDFILRRFDMNRALLSPVRITARFEQGLAMAGDERADKIIFQQPALALGTVHDERLRNWGFWNITRGKPHARDAIRHALTALRRAKETLRTVPSENENENDCH